MVVFVCFLSGRSPFFLPDKRLTFLTTGLGSVPGTIINQGEIILDQTYMAVLQYAKNQPKIEARSKIDVGELNVINIRGKEYKITIGESEYIRSKREDEERRAIEEARNSQFNSKRKRNIQQTYKNTPTRRSTVSGQAEVIGTDYRSCYMYAMQETGKDLYGYRLAKNLPVNSEEPTPGGLVVTYESRAGHVAIIEKVEGDNITIREANYIKGRSNTRVISKNYAKIKGFIN